MNHKDLTEAARAVLDYKPKLCTGKPCSCCDISKLLYAFHKLATPEAILALIEALTEETERCASFADFNHEMHPECECESCTTSKAIAAAIRGEDDPE